MTAHYVNKEDPERGFYEVYTGPEGSRWQWSETTKDDSYEDFGPWRTSVSDAYRDAADDWESNGDNSNKRLSGQLRAAATRAEKK